MPSPAAYDFYLVKGDLQPILPIQLQDSSGTPVSLTSVGPNGVTFVMTDSGGATVISRTAAIDNAALGQIHYTWQGTDTAKAGSYRAKFQVAFPAGLQTFPSPNGLSILIRDEMPADPLALAVLPYPQPAGGGGPNYTTPGYPYATGYARMEDVISRVNAGTWDPDDPTASPSRGQVEQWLMEAAANLDVAMATRGYYVPFEPLAGWVPLGQQTWNGIGVGAWLLLRNVAAAYGAHFVQLTRHGGVGADNTKNAEHWMTLFDDLLTRLETGADNLEAFGCGGTFAPQIDPAKAARSGSLGMMLSDSSQQEGPIFTKGENWGSGYESTTPGPPTSGTPFSG